LCVVQGENDLGINNKYIIEKIDYKNLFNNKYILLKILDMPFFGKSPKNSMIFYPYFYLMFHNKSKFSKPSITPNRCHETITVKKWFWSKIWNTFLALACVGFFWFIYHWNLLNFCLKY
jgi:hypothetical protein